MKDWIAYRERIDVRRALRAIERDAERAAQFRAFAWLHFWEQAGRPQWRATTFDVHFGNRNGAS